jgi:hypothetical protein
MHQHLHFAEKISKLLDNQFSLGKFRFGLDPLLGLIPAGDTLTLFLSLYIVGIGFAAKLPARKIFQMIFNVAIDYFIGLIPFIGDFFDFGFKSNVKNINILRQHLGIIEEGVVL